MKTLYKIAIVLCVLTSNVYSEAANFYAYFINNSTSKAVRFPIGGSNQWDNYGWSPCGDWNATIQPGQSGLLCGGSTNNHTYGYLAYDIYVSSVFNGAGNYSRRNAVVVDSGGGVYLSIKNGTGNNDGGDFLNFHNYNGNDMVIIYVFDDNGFSISLLDAGGMSSYFNNGLYTSFNLQTNNCGDSNYSGDGGGCMYYQKYDNV